jgi:hypothetical protein
MTQDKGKAKHVTRRAKYYRDGRDGREMEEKDDGRAMSGVA